MLKSVSHDSYIEGAPSVNDLQIVPPSPIKEPRKQASDGHQTCKLLETWPKWQHLCYCFCVIVFILVYVILGKISQ